MSYKQEFDKLTRKLKIRNVLIRECLAEFIGTFALCSLGMAVSTQYVIGGKTYDWGTIPLAWGFSVSIGIWIATGVSGGHVNPAISMGFTVTGHLPWRKLPIYMLGQYLGALCGTAMVFCLYLPALNDYDGGIRQALGPNGTAATWCTFPNDHTPWYLCVIDELNGGGMIAILTGIPDAGRNSVVVLLSYLVINGTDIIATGFLLLGTFAYADPKNMNMPCWLLPHCVGILVFVIGMGYSLNCGGPLNPARDLAPRIILAMAGYGHEVFTYRDIGTLLAPQLGTLVGGAAGALIYTLFISSHWPEPEDQDKAANIEVKDKEVDEESVCEKLELMPKTA